MISRLDCNASISRFDPTRDTLPTWPQWMRVGMRKLGRDIVLAAASVATWADRAGERYRLQALDDRMLKDIGISRADVWAEAVKPMWRK